MTIYSDGTAVSQPYKELYSKISVVNVGLGLDIYFNRFLGTHALYNRFQTVLTPTVYGQFFKADIYDKVNDTDSPMELPTENVVYRFGRSREFPLSYRFRLGPATKEQLTVDDR